MAATLSITLSKSGGTGSPLSLKADHVEHQIARYPAQVGLPSEPNKDSNIFMLDLGMKVEQISCSGLVDVAPNDGTSSKSQLETAARQWWAYGDAGTDFAKMSIDSSNSYYGAIKQVNFQQDGALEDRWKFDLIFLVFKQA